MVVWTTRKFGKFDSLNLDWKKGTRRKRKKWDIQKRDFNFVLFEIGVAVYIRIAHTPSPQGVALFEKIMR